MITFVLGGARSGKSRYAQELAQKQAGEQVLYVATLRVTPEILGDPEMARRIDKHQRSRPATWTTLIVGDDFERAIPAAIRQHDSQGVLLDCVSVLLSGLLFMNASAPDDPETEAEAAMRGLLRAHDASGVPWIVVSNEVGLSVVPEDPATRAYRDALGRANQAIAAAAKTVYFMMAGIPMRIK